MQVETSDRQVARDRRIAQYLQCVLEFVCDRTGEVPIGPARIDQDVQDAARACDDDPVRQTGASAVDATPARFDVHEAVTRIDGVDQASKRRRIGHAAADQRRQGRTGAPDLGIVLRVGLRPGHCEQPDERRRKSSRASGHC
jgi:hypothetical protein